MLSRYATSAGLVANCRNAWSNFPKVVFNHVNCRGQSSSPHERSDMRGWTIPRMSLRSSGLRLLMANALGVADREAMHGIIRQLVKASVSGESPDEVNLAFMISMVKSIKPRDSIEAMLVAQMVSVHVMAMRCAHHLANADDLAQHDSAARALGRLARTFPAQIEALNRYRSQGEPAITVQNVKVEDGGKAIVGNVTQHARVIVSDKRPASAARKAPKASGARRRRDSTEARRAAEA
jgi:hypothetical protein